MSIPNGYLWKISAIYEVNKFMPRKAWITINRSIVEYKGRNTAPINWAFKSKEEPGRLICLKSRNVVKGYIQVPGVDYTEQFSLVAIYTSTRIIIGLTLYQE